MWTRPLRRWGEWLARHEVAAGVFVLLVAGWFYADETTRWGPWGGWPDMESVFVADALALNSGQVPDCPHHPGIVSTIAQSLALRLGLLTGATGVSDWAGLEASANPLLVVAEHLHLLRSYSWGWVVLYGLGWWLLWRQFASGPWRAVVPLAVAVVLWPTTLVGLVLAVRSETAGLAFFTLGWAAWHRGQATGRPLWLTVGGGLWAVCLFAKMSFLPHLILAGTASALWAVGAAAADGLPQPEGKGPTAAGRGWQFVLALGPVFLAVGALRVCLWWPYDWATLNYGTLGALSPVGAVLLLSAVLPLWRLAPTKWQSAWPVLQNLAQSASWAWVGAAGATVLLWLVAGGHEAATRLLAAAVQALFYFEVRPDVARMAGGLSSLGGRVRDWLLQPPFALALVGGLWLLAWGRARAAAMAWRPWLEWGLWGAVALAAWPVVLRFVLRDAPLFEAGVAVVATVALALAARSGPCPRPMALAMLGLIVVMAGGQVARGRHTAQLWAADLPFHNWRPQRMLAPWTQGPAAQAIVAASEAAFGEGHHPASLRAAPVDATLPLARDWHRLRQLWTVVLPNRRITARDATVAVEGVRLPRPAGGSWEMGPVPREAHGQMLVLGHRLPPQAAWAYDVDRMQFRTDTLRKQTGELPAERVALLNRADLQLVLWVASPRAHALTGLAPEVVLTLRSPLGETLELSPLEVPLYLEIPAQELGTFWLVGLSERPLSMTSPLPPMVVPLDE